MFKTIIISLFIIITLNYLLDFIKNLFTKPIIRYIGEKEMGLKSKIEKEEKEEEEKKEKKEENENESNCTVNCTADSNDMNSELANFLKMQIDIKNNISNYK